MRMEPQGISSLKRTVIFTGKILVFWIGVCLWKVVSYEVGNDNSKELAKKVKADSLELVEVLYHWAR